jgi:hypothetical protein
MCGVERVEHVGHGHRIGSDLQVVGLIEDALVWEWPTISTLAAPVAASTLVTKEASCPADAAISPVPRRSELADAPP